MNLDELKAKNKAEGETQVKTEDKKPATEETTEIIVDPEPDGEVSEGEDLSAFIDIDEQTSKKEDETNDYVPLKTHLSLKSKVNKFKGEVKEKTDENDRLRTERDKLKGQTYKPVELKRPIKEDFDTDEDYYAANDAFYDARTVDTINRTNHQTTQQKAQEKTLQNIEKGVDDHYVRVEKLCEKHKIKPDTYKAAETKFISLVESAFPGKGEFIANAMIADIGKGSGSVVLSIGINEAKSNKFMSLLHNDPNGTKVPMYFGQLKSELNKSGKRVSSARSPATDIKGDASPNAGGAEKRKYDAAHAKGDVQSAIDIKSAAKSNGADTSSW